MMPKYFAPGIFLEPTSFTRGPIVSVATAATAFVGATLKGPVHTATQVNSVAEYRELFGAPSPASPVSISVLQFFSNGGRQAVVVRTAASGGRSRPRTGHADIVGDAGKGTGIHALGTSPPVGLMVTPDAGVMSLREHDALLKAVLTYCERHRIFYIADAPKLRSTRDPIDSVIGWAGRAGAITHANAAVYFPQVRMSDPSGRSGCVVVSASGAVAGVYARTDHQHGVWQAPAGTKASLLGVTGVEVQSSDNQAARLTGAGINPLRSFPAGGILIWGARTLASAVGASEWKYVPVRRLSLFLQRSVEAGLGWTVFEPNDEPLWAQIRLSVSSFLNHLFQRGAFMGASTREAYFVKCGRDTMTANDINTGRIIVVIGFAPLKPAEFVMLRLEFQAGH